MKFARALNPSFQLPLTVGHFHSVTLDTKAKLACVDGMQHSLELGRWMYYLPTEQLKLFHARDGKIDCTHAVRPADDESIADDAKVGRYTMGDWRRALNTPIFRRLAEIWLVSARLWRAGLGPQPLGIVKVEQFSRDEEMLGPTCGIRTQNVAKLPRKLECRIEHIQSAGVKPDHILSCVRQQRRGYVIDLCSVIGCQPVDADAEIARLTTELIENTDKQQLIAILEETLNN